jgi:hypothetical protein
VELATVLFWPPLLSLTLTAAIGASVSVAISPVSTKTGSLTSTEAIVPTAAFSRLFLLGVLPPVVVTGTVVEGVLTVVEVLIVPPATSPAGPVFT